MKVIDPKSMLIGILITLLVFSTLGLRSKTDELGHLVVRSLTIEDDRGVIMGCRLHAMPCNICVNIEQNTPLRHYTPPRPQSLSTPSLQFTHTYNTPHQESILR